MVEEINRPDMRLERQRFTKECMLNFFKRNMVRPNKEKEHPSYLKPFSADKIIDEKDQTATAKELLKQLKEGTYDIHKEELLLTKLYRSIGQRGDVADKIIAKLGMKAILAKKSHDS
jgi:ribosomal protein L9